MQERTSKTGAVTGIIVVASRLLVRLTKGANVCITFAHPIKQLGNRHGRRVAWGQRVIIEMDADNASGSRKATANAERRENRILSDRVIVDPPRYPNPGWRVVVFEGYYLSLATTSGQRPRGIPTNASGRSTAAVLVCES